MARNPKQDANLAPPFTSNQDHEEAVKNGRRGGIESGRKRREKRDAREAVRYILGLAATGNFLNHTMDIGAKKKDGITNMEALQARIFTRAMTGDLEAYQILMKVAGYDEAERRKDRESEARVRAMDKSGIPVSEGVDVATRNEVMIVLPDDGRGAPGAVGITESDAESLTTSQQN